MAKARLRKDGRYESRLYSGGRYKSFYGRTASESEDKLKRYKAGSIPVKCKTDMTVRQLCGQWLFVTRTRHKPSTEANYIMKFHKHIFPAVGGLTFESVRADDIHGFIAALSGYSPSYVHDIIVLLKSVFTYACRTYGAKNVFDNVTLPPKKKVPQNIYNNSERDTLIAFLKKNRSRTALAVFLSLFMGLRLGEVCGLMWKDIDPERKILHINRTVYRISCFDGPKKTRLVMGTPKSLNSLRSVPIPDFLLLQLLRYKGDDDKFVISGKKECTQPRTLQNRFKRVLKEAGLRAVNYHSLRHVFATTAIELSADYKTLSELLGHSSPAVTMKLYVHSSDERKRACMALFDKLA